MTDDLEDLIKATEGQGPSAEFVARLRSEIVTETEISRADTNYSGTRTVAPLHDSNVADVRDPDDEITVMFDLEIDRGDQGAENRRAVWQRRLQMVGAAAAAAAIIFLGVWGLTSGDDDRDSELDTVDTPESPDSSLDPESAGVPLTAGNTFFDAGTFRIDTLGTGFTLTVEETRGLLVNENDIVLITDLTSRNADDRTITFRRMSLLPDPAAPTADFDRSTGWPANDLVGWLELLGDDVNANSATDTTLGGRDATFVELEFPCTGVNCAANLPRETPDLPMFTPGSRYRLWVVDQGQEDPIVVVVAIDDDEAGWFDEADGILATLEFGPVERNPLRRIPAGQVELDTFDGISLELSEETVVVEPFEHSARIFVPGIGVDGPQQPGLGWGGDVEFLTRPLDTDGVEVTTTERLLELLADEAVELSELDAFDIGGFDARTFDIDSGGNPNVVLKVRAADLVRAEFGWESPRTGHVWVVEHPERGLLLVSAEDWVGPGDFESLRPWTEELLGTLEFREP